MRPGRASDVVPERPQEAKRHGGLPDDAGAEALARPGGSRGRHEQEDFIMARLHDETIAVAPNIRVYRALRENMLELLRELSRIQTDGTVDERLHDEVERLTKEFIDLRGEVDAATVNTERHDILEISRRWPCMPGR